MSVPFDDKNMAIMYVFCLYVLYIPLFFILFLAIYSLLYFIKISVKDGLGKKKIDPFP